MCIKIRHFKIKNQKFSGEGAPHTLFSMRHPNKNPAYATDHCVIQPPNTWGEIMKDWGTHGEREARAYYRGLGAEAPAESRGRAPGGGQGAKPPEAESIVACGRPVETAKLPHSLFLQTQYT